MYSTKLLKENSKELNENNIREIISEGKRRFCFKTKEDNGKQIIWKPKEGTNMFICPFKESIEKLISEYVGKPYFTKTLNDNYSMELEEKDLGKFEEFKNNFYENVFIRDLLDLSMALSFNKYNADDDVRTPIGDLEYQAKYKNESGSKNKLVTLVDDWLSKTKIYKDADAICAIPPSKGSAQNLPQYIAENLENFQNPNISGILSWGNKTTQMKNLSKEDKLDALIVADLNIDTTKYDLNGKKIILLDDLYQSGQTMMYVAMKLKEAGASEVYGLSIVKSLSY